ncbi:peptidyl-prolyl cis-trans isomerase, FKBP-type domain-containing protein [Besnoitia besnoiti]|uniref:peptidylprolyl isomerase n=1 Tax=Besnoitia besnoiti TaxID=94643 RepID=A0A2A9MLH1_BESBE|nr:peptidyl-prolyl cis-trans isomerase, FKBP-type domain-containing protein [Besnoitia besnoiti]PFH36310.1 peptidyl-prolyl cis-trans isomerase, FKBP-type domain-containing protein [Besnoitia besnoiti]
MPSFRRFSCASSRLLYPLFPLTRSLSLLFLFGFASAPFSPPLSRSARVSCSEPAHLSTSGSLACAAAPGSPPRSSPSSFAPSRLPRSLAFLPAAVGSVEAAWAPPDPLALSLEPLQAEEETRAPEKKLFAWAQYRESVVACEACRALAELLRERLRDVGGLSDCASRPPPPSPLADLAGDAAQGSDGGDQDAWDPRGAPARRRDNDALPRERDAQSAAPKDDSRRDSSAREAHEVSASAAGRGARRRGTENEKRSRFGRVIAVDAALDASTLCTFGYWKPFADRTDDLAVSEMLRECRALLNAEREGLSAFLNSRECLSGRLLESFLCAPRSCELRDNEGPGDASETKAARNLRLSREFLAWNRQQLGVEEAASGLQFRLLGQRRDARAESPESAEDVVHMHYIGKRLNGETFENTFRRGHAAVVQLGKLVPGWQEALRLLKPGDAMHAYIPPHLGFGELGLDGKVDSNEVLLLHLHLEFVEKQTRRKDRAKDAPDERRAGDSKQTPQRESSVHEDAEAAARRVGRHTEL